MYNAISVVIFHFSWKYQSGIWGIRGQAYLSSGTFESNSVAINGWLRDFLWSQSSQVIQSYGSYAGSYGLMFLAATVGLLVHFLLIRKQGISGPL